MLIVNEDLVINLDNVIFFEIVSEEIYFNFRDNHHDFSLKFHDVDEAQACYEKILHSYEYDKKVVYV